MATLTIRIDEDLKNDAAEVAEYYGFDLSSITRAFYKQMVRDHAIPISLGYGDANTGSTSAHAKGCAPYSEINSHTTEEADCRVLYSVAKACFQSYVVARNMELSGHLDTAMSLYSASEVKDELYPIWYSISDAEGMVVDPRTGQLVPISDYGDLSLYYKTLFEMFGKPGPSYMGEGDPYERLETAKQSFSEAVELVLSAYKTVSGFSAADKKRQDYYFKLLQKMQSIEESMQTL